MASKCRVLEERARSRVDDGYKDGDDSAKVSHMMSLFNSVFLHNFGAWVQNATRLVTSATKASFNLEHREVKKAVLLQ